MMHVNCNTDVVCIASLLAMAFCHLLLDNALLAVCPTFAI